MLLGRGINVKLRKTLVGLPDETEILMGLFRFKQSICAGLDGYPSGVLGGGSETTLS